jgi:hypothetical protein
VCTQPQISLSNGNGLTTLPRWFVVFNIVGTPTDNDVWGTMFDLQGSVILSRAITIDSTDDLYPQVSSPLVDLDGPQFMVSYEQQVGSTSEMVVRIMTRDIVTAFPQLNLTRRYGFSGVFSRVESDGTRFAATTKVANAIRIGTLAILNNDVVLHEALQNINNGDFPHIASKRSGGGTNTDYGIVYIGSSQRAALATYQGRAPTGGFVQRFTGCGPLGLQSSGQPLLGRTLQFTLTNAGTGPFGFLIGLPATAVTLCSNCQFGVDLSGPLVGFPSPLSLPLPPEPRLVGLTLAVQGYALGSGRCPPAAIYLSDTIDFTIQ